VGAAELSLVKEFKQNLVILAKKITKLCSLDFGWGIHIDIGDFG